MDDHFACYEKAWNETAVSKIVLESLIIGKNCVNCGGFSRLDGTLHCLLQAFFEYVIPNL